MGEKYHIVSHEYPAYFQERLSQNNMQAKNDGTHIIKHERNKPKKSGEEGQCTNIIKFREITPTFTLKGFLNFQILFQMFNYIGFNLASQLGKQKIRFKYQYNLQISLYNATF